MILSHSLSDPIHKFLDILAKGHFWLTGDQRWFLYKWYKLDGKLDLEFGFTNVRGLEDQWNSAVHFYINTELEWYNARTIEKSDVSFLDFFVESAKKELISLPENFKESIQKEENYNEPSGIEDLGNQESGD